MTSIRRVAVSAAMSGAALVAGVALAVGPAVNAAHADGPNTPTRTVRTIESAPWVTLEQGDRGYRVAAVSCYLDYFDYYQGCKPTTEMGDLFTPELTKAVEDYQEAHNLPTSGDVDTETWGALRDDVGLVKPGDNRKDVVQGVQYSLNVLGKEGLRVDGHYGAKTEGAVERFQERKEIGVDGIVGPITFRAMYAKGAEAQGLPR